MLLLRAQEDEDEDLAILLAMSIDLEDGDPGDGEQDHAQQQLHSSGTCYPEQATAAAVHSHAGEQPPGRARGCFLCRSCRQ